TSRGRRGVTLLELLIVVAVMAGLAAILLPAIQQSREAARKAACLSNLRQVGVALTSYAARTGRLPRNGPTPSRVAVAGDVEMPSLARQYDHRYDAYSSAANSELGRAPFPLLECPSDESQRVAPWQWCVSNTLLNSALNGASLQICTDGLSHTAL